MNRACTDVVLPPAPPRLRKPLFVGGLQLELPFTLAPLAGYTNLPFRLSVREQGAPGLAVTDLINARAILEGSKKSLELLATTPADRPLSVQIFGAVPEEMAAAAQWLEDYGATVVDINMGCPVRKVVRTGGGSAMMCDPGNAIRLVERVVRSVRIPVTVKMRLGWDARNLTAPFFAREFEQIGVAAVTVHGRTREQGFTGTVDLAGIRAVVEAVERIPVIGNGDVRTIADAHRMFSETGCAAIAIGRGALANPWIFRQLRQWIETGQAGPAMSYEQRLDFMEVHLRRLIEWRGEHGGCLMFRKIANWYSKALRVNKSQHQRLLMLDSAATFAAVLDELRQAGPPPHWHPISAADALAIPVPSGPIAHW
jgi:tRNA-dihydrouridine synthase B